MMHDNARGTRLSRRGVLGAAGLAAAASFSAPASASARPIARTQYGRVRGTTEQGVHVFKGVRYGADTRPTRFQAPGAPRPWRGVLDATAYGPACPQSGDAETQSEDCLFVNVWTRGLSDNGRRPVMVYFHGGAYASGSGSHALYDGARLALRGDVVVVTVNHRLNVFGYGYFARLTNNWADVRFADSGNAGQLDLILALQWVRDNIEAFGGDPNNVTVFGQSGGGAKIATLMAMPAAAGLFHRAITMSGQQVTASGPLNATTRADAYLNALGLDRAGVSELAELSVAQLTAGLNAEDPVLGGRVYFGPVLDMKHLLRHPFYPDAAAQSLHIPMMLGNTKDETRAFVGNDRSYFELGWDEVSGRLETQMRIDAHPEAVLADFRAQFPNKSPSDLYFLITTAARSWRGQVIEAEERAKAGAPAYVYQMDWQSPRDGGMWGAPHTIDIPLAFGNLEASNFIEGRPADAEAISSQVMDAFIAFARSGDPNCASIPEWTPHLLPERATMIFDNEVRLEHDPRQWQREYFARIPYVQPGT